MYFESIIGNDDNKKYLTNSLTNNNVLHAYIFTGIVGLGKFLFARDFAKGILCNNSLLDKCNCKSCISFNSDNHPDFYIIEPEGNSISEEGLRGNSKLVTEGKTKKQGVIKIEQIRNIQITVYEKPIISNKKVYVINNSDKMTTQAQNALLKTLEEPPGYVTFILITSNEKLLLPTITSRCNIIKFNPITSEELQGYFDDVPLDILKLANGSIGNVINLKENMELYNKVSLILENIEKNNLVDTLNNWEKVVTKENIKIVLNYLNNKFIKDYKIIFILDEATKKLNANVNFDMLRDDMILNIHKTRKDI